MQVLQDVLDILLFSFRLLFNVLLELFDGAGISRHVEVL